MHAPFDNLALKALSLGLAGLLWFVIAGETTSEIGLSAPVELQNFPHGLELTGDLINSVNVRVRASPEVIQGLGPGEITAQIDLKDAEEGERIVHLTEQTIRVPFGVKVVNINPSTVTLNLERTLEKTVPVRPRLLGRPAPGQEVAEVASVPGEVRIGGPKGRVQEVESAFTEPLLVEGARATVEDYVNLGLEDPLVRIQGSPRVKVTARIREVHEKRRVEGLEVEVRGGSAAVRPPRVQVVLAGPASVLTRVPARAVHPYVEVSKLSAPRRLPVAVQMDSGHLGVTVENVEPPEVMVRPLRRKD